MNKIESLAKFLNVESETIEANNDGETFEHDGSEYLILTDEEADAKCRDYVENTAWAFKAEFIASHTRNGLNSAAIKALGKMQVELCENANELVLALVEDVNAFFQDAVRSDGRGHFLSSYDGEEVESGEFYIYQTN